MTGDVDTSRVRVEDIAPYFDHALHVDFELFLKMLSKAGEHSAEDLLPEIRVPVLVAAGDRDPFTPPEVSRAMAEAIPGAEFELLRGASHVAPLEQRERAERAAASLPARKGRERCGIMPSSEARRPASLVSAPRAPRA